MNKRASDSMTLVAALVDHAHVLSGVVLDAGCGAMPYKRLSFPDVQGWVGLDVRDGVGQITSDMCDMREVDDESFDTVLCIDSLQYAIDPARAVEEFYRVLNPGGRLLLIAPNCQTDEQDSLWGFKVEGVRMMFSRAGFEVESLRTASRQFVCEYENSKITKYGFAIPPEINGFVQRLDDAFPHIVVAVGYKAEG